MELLGQYFLNCGKNCPITLTNLYPISSMSEFKLLSKAKREARIVHRYSVWEVIQRRSKLPGKVKQKSQYKNALSR